MDFAVGSKYFYNLACKSLEFRIFSSGTRRRVGVVNLLTQGHHAINRRV
jgi:hypothetical protein